jgi:dTDP-4-dehydrorhamnose 3,5-epimerase
LSRLFCSDLLQQLFKNRKIIQINHTITPAAGTSKGFHYQSGVSAEAKLVICIKGKVLDVAVDLRKSSRTLCTSYSSELSAENMNALFIPRGFAHGFQALEDNTELLYLHDNFYSPENEAGVNIFEPKIAIQWPLTPHNLSERDMNFPHLDREFEGIDFEM